MKKFDINLQLFADGEPEESIDNMEPVDNEEPVDNTEPIDDSVEDNDNQSEPSEDNNNDIPEGYIPKEKVSEIIRQRVNKLNEKYKNYNKYQQAMNKLIQMSGLTEEQFYTQLERLELQQKAQQLGVSPEIVKQIEESQRAVEEARRTTLNMKYEMEEAQLKSNPLYEDYDSVKDQVREVAERTGMSLEQAYWATYGPQLLQKQTKMTEQRVNHNQRYKYKRDSVEIDGGSKMDKNPAAKLSESEIRMASKLGMSPDEYALYNNDDLSYDDILEMRKRKGGKN